jgi:hypothetical protein
MKVEYISHACLLIETADLKIATDPWFNGGAYCNQWHVFPRPVNTEILNDADVILISHGHEDHLHEATLKLMPKSARVLYPYSFFGGAKEYIESIGFTNVREAVTYKRIKLSPKTAVTFLLNSHDSIMIIESDGKVLVNANDALHSYPEKVIDFHLAEIKKTWKNIDILFCGFGGASYFPNTMHLEGKDDKEIAIVREQLFAHNFCRVVAGLKPKVAVPFAADFALLADEQRWINHYRFPRSKMREYYRKHFSKNDDCEPQIYDMYPGDKLELYELRAESPYRKQMRDDSLEHLIDEQYVEEIAKLDEQIFISEAEAEKLVEEIRRNVEKRVVLYKPEKLQNLKFCLQITDVAERNFYNISFAEEKPQVERAEKPDDSILLTMRLRSEILRSSLSSDWGADAISIGYGAEIHFSDKKLAEIDLESVCINLLACYPIAMDMLKKFPLRALEFMISNPLKYTRSLKQLKKYNSESENYDREVWLLKSADEIRQIYNLPNLEAEFLPSSTIL